MSKKFDIHKWQAKQRKKILTENKPLSLPQKGGEVPKIQEDRTSLDKAVDSIITMIDGRLATWQLKDKITNSHDMMNLFKRDKEKLKMMTYNILRDDYNPNITKEHHSGEYKKGFLKKTVSSFLDDLKKKNETDYDKVEDIIEKHFSVDEMSTTGTGASFNAGAGMGHFGDATKKKRKKQ
tara:strand:+ start:34 stop:573 length:540 start_codon:yes stop_codon:yes gene_type:complete